MFNINGQEEFEKIKTIGKGAFGTAFLCKRLSDNQQIVLKEIYIQEMDDDERKQTMNEVKILSSLTHPNIIKYIGKFENNGYLIIMMEYADGGNLAQLIKITKERQETFTELKILLFLSDITSAVSYMHKRKVLHRDLKAANIFLTKHGIVKIGDFGISKILSNTKSQAQTVVGTPCYLSPEMCEGNDYNEKSDIWALGCILYEMACLRKPFEASTLPVLIQKIKMCDFQSIPVVYSKGLSQLVYMLLNKDFRSRPSAEDIHNNFIPQLIGDLQNPVESNTATSQLTKNISKERSVLYVVEGNIEDIDLVPIPLPNKKIIDVSVSKSHCAVVLLDSLVYTWGENRHGQLAHGDTATFLRVPVCVNYLRGKEIIKCAVGDGFSIFLNKNGVVYSCGYGGKGCLGQGDWSNVTRPTIISSILTVNITQIACGFDHVLALSVDGQLYSWGSSKHGQLGQGHKQYCCTPKCIDFKYKIDQIYAGYHNSAILTNDGRVFVCGSNDCNKLGLDESDTVATFVLLENIPEKVTHIHLGVYHMAMVTENGNVICTGRNVERQTETINISNHTKAKLTSITGTKIISAACGLTYTVALSDENVLYFWGAYFRNKEDTYNANDFINYDTVLLEKSHLKEEKKRNVNKPKPILALYASKKNRNDNNILWLQSCYTVDNKLFILIHTTVPVAAKR